MANTTAPVYERLPAYVDLGYQTEQYSRTRTFDVSAMLEELPGAAVSLVVLRPKESEAYLADTALSGDTLTWTINAYDTEISGKGSCQVMLTDASDPTKVLLSQVIPVTVNASIVDSDAEVPEPYAAWMGRVATAVNGVEAAVSAANAAADKLENMSVSAASGASAGANVSTVDGHYHLDLTLPKGDKGDTGETGSPGATGVGLNAALCATSYQASGSGTAIPAGTWYDTPAAAGAAKGQYLWTRTVLTFTDGTTQTAYGVSYLGRDGDGAGVTDPFAGATAQTSGVSGLVPAPAAGDQNKYLRGNGTWSEPAARHGGTPGSIAEQAVVEGYQTMAAGSGAHAEGYGSTAVNDAAHAEGYYTAANGSYSHAEGERTQADGRAAHAEGYGTSAARKSQHVFGEYNTPESGSASSRGAYVEIVGNGSGSGSTSNARTLDWSGNEVLAGSVTATAFIGDGSQLTNLPTASVSQMTAATTTDPGTGGTVPAPGQAQQNAFLGGDAAWHSLSLSSSGATITLRKDSSIQSTTTIGTATTYSAGLMPADHYAHLNKIKTTVLWLNSNPDATECSGGTATLLGNVSGFDFLLIEFCYRSSAQYLQSLLVTASESRSIALRCITKSGGVAARNVSISGYSFTYEDGSLSSSNGTQNEYCIPLRVTGIKL